MNLNQRPPDEHDPQTRHRLWMVLLTYSPAVAVVIIFLTAGGRLTPHRLAAMGFCLGLVGLIIMARRESPTVLGSLRGKWAIAQGALITAAFWLAALYFLFS
jgi:hypothetical protein